MAQLKDLIVTGAARIIGNIYGNLKGNADTATKATQDGNGNNIVNTYATKTELSGKADKTGLATVATSGSYNDLSNKPTINNYSHPTTSGNKHIPSGGSSGQILRWSADGTATWGADNNTTYNNATTSAAGLMSAADKIKLDNTIIVLENFNPSTGELIIKSIK